MNKKVTLREWADAHFGVKHTDKTLQRWARECWILPMPQKVGRHWLVDQNAEYVGPNGQMVSHESQAA